MCTQPISLVVERKTFLGEKHPIKQTLKVPCGHCPECRSLRRLQWVFRLENEAKVHAYNYFITLTYSDKYLPKDGQLYKPDFQDFMKRLRKNLGFRLKYFTCGEYGDTFGRCHWHSILFADSPITVDDIRRAWTYGFVKFSPFSSSRAAYVVKYTQKQLHAIYPDDIEPPCTLCSQGLGDSYFTPSMRKYYRINGITEVVLRNHQKTQMPRRYYDQIFSTHDRLLMSKKKQDEKFRKDLEEFKKFGIYAGQRKNKLSFERSFVHTLRRTGKLNELQFSAPLQQSYC